MVITVLLADDHGVLRDGVRRVLEANSDIRVVAVADNGHDALAKATVVRPNVALLDISMPGLSGIEATRAIVATLPGTAVVILSMHSSIELVKEALCAGARGYLLKESAGEEVVKAVRVAAAGRRFLGAGITDLLVEGCIHGRVATTALLTPRERDVLRLVVDGKSNIESAAALGLSPRSVETYRLRLMQKLGLSDLPSLVKFAIRHGLTTLE
jgi:DNA-binding NarL/FixJ family response regulator